MEDFTVGDVLRAANGRLIRGNSESIVSGISTDSRTLVEGDLFVALVGEQFDGHDFIIQAVNKGAAGVLVSRNIEETPIETIIQVEDTLHALGDTAGTYRKKFDVPVVGITGSNGKTTTKDMTASVLARKYSVLKNEGNLNNAIGVPLTLFRLSREHEAAVIEMGTGAPGEMGRLVEIAQPNVAVVTNIGPTHQEFFGSIDEVAVEKAVLVRAADSAALNADDPRVAGMLDVVHGQVVSFGLAGDKPTGRNACAAVLAAEVGQDQDGRAEFTLVIGNDEVRIHLKALGRHNIYNALAAASVGWLFHVDLHEIREALESYQGTPLRMQKNVVDGITIINDTYNSNPASLRAAVELLSEMECDGKRVAVVGDMLELGMQADELHRAAGRFIADCPVDLLVTVGDEAARIAEAALAAGVPDDRTTICRTNSQAVAYLRETLKAGDTVLIKGSRGMKMEEIAESLKQEFGE
jgi:UDP-N-acetylmuramoyl-tripeptide--D-alanyl-D-alanine ligase